MNVTGIIAEYNPFHNGHLYQIRAAREHGADFLVVAMSGDFVQRGEPAVFDKYTRARMALAAGADLILELPVCFATASAEDFAGCGVALLTALGTVNELCFGSECKDLGILRQLSAVLSEEPEAFRSLLREKVRTGAPFPQARAEALEEYRAALTGKADAHAADSPLHELLSGPNNILALEYLKAIQKQGSPLTPFAVHRKGAAYHNLSLDAGQEFASAAALRKAIRNAGIPEMPQPSGNGKVQRGADPGFAGTPCRANHLDSLLARHIPKDSLNALFSEGALLAPLFADDLSSALSYRLLLAAKEEEDLAAFADVSPELAARLRRGQLSFGSFTDTVRFLKTRTYTWTRVSRALLHILLAIRRDKVSARRAAGYVSYARILGFRQSAVPLLSHIKKTSGIPLVTKIPDAFKKLPEPAAGALKEDLFASHLWQSAAALKGRRMKNEYTRSVIVLPDRPYPI